jgi:hypothetical protein
MYLFILFYLFIVSVCSIPIWLAWTLVGGLNRDHAYAHEFGDGCVAFGLFCTATLILFAMFLPKVGPVVPETLHHSKQEKVLTVSKNYM